jgi:hypothetical protein
MIRFMLDNLHLPGRAHIMLCALATALSAQTPPVVSYPNPSAVKALTAAPVLDIGGDGGGIEFNRVGAILAVRGGGFAVVNGPAAIHFFDAAGKQLSISGRRGQGPAEYQSIRSVVRWKNDSIVVMDGMTRRLSILTPDGTFAHSFNLKPPWEGGGFPTAAMALGDGTILVGYSDVIRRAPQPEPVFFGQRLYAYAPTGELRSDAFIGLNATEHFIQSAPPQMGGVAYWDRAFARRMTARADSAGLIVGDGTDWSFEQRSATGTVVRTHRMNRPVTAVSEADRLDWGTRTRGKSVGDQLARMERLIAEMPWPKTKPAYRTFELDETGRIWAEIYPELGDSAATWVRLDPRRRTSTAVKMPARFRAMAFSANRVYGIWRDTDDVEHVRVYRLEGF